MSGNWQYLQIIECGEIWNSRLLFQKGKSINFHEDIFIIFQMGRNHQLDVFGKKSSLLNYWGSIQRALYSFTV